MLPQRGVGFDAQKVLPRTALLDAIARPRYPHHILLVANNSDVADFSVSPSLSRTTEALARRLDFRGGWMLTDKTFMANYLFAFHFVSAEALVVSSLNDPLAVNCVGSV